MLDPIGLGILLNMDYVMILPFYLGFVLVDDLKGRPCRGPLGVCVRDVNVPMAYFKPVARLLLKHLCLFKLKLVCFYRHHVL